MIDDPQDPTPVSESLLPPGPGESVRLVSAALIGEAQALIRFLETHVTPLNSAGVPIVVEGPGGTPLLSVRIEVRAGNQRPFVVLVVS